MKIVSLVVAFCFSLNVFANAGTVLSLEQSLNEYQYSLSVEWDQKDQNFFDSKTKELFSNLDQLMKEDGLTKDEVLAFISSKAKNKNLVDAVKLKLSLLDKNISTEELSKMVAESSKEIYSKGASWNGDVIIPVIGVVVLAAFVGYVAWWEANHECVKTENVYSCETYDSCTGLTSMGVRSTFAVGYNYGYSSCIGFPITNCGYRNVCTEYVKK